MSLNKYWCYTLNQKKATTCGQSNTYFSLLFHWLMLIVHRPDKAFDQQNSKNK